MDLSADLPEKLASMDVPAQLVNLDVLSGAALILADMGNEEEANNWNLKGSHMSQMSDALPVMLSASRVQQALSKKLSSNPGSNRADAEAAWLALAATASKEIISLQRRSIEGPI
eukprot:15456818-Alexandrium_andersonii.AAC.1